MLNISHVDPARAPVPATSGRIKRVEAIIRAHKLDELREALVDLGISGMTVTEVRGLGRSGGSAEVYRGTAHVVDFTPKLKIEVVALEDLARQIVELVTSSARTGKIGDGKVFVTEVQECVRVRTGERGRDAL